MSVFACAQWHQHSFCSKHPPRRPARPPHPSTPQPTHHETARATTRTRPSSPPPPWSSPSWSRAATTSMSSPTSPPTTRTSRPSSRTRSSTSSCTSAPCGTRTASGPRSRRSSTGRSGWVSAWGLSHGASRMGASACGLLHAAFACCMHAAACAPHADLELTAAHPNQPHRSGTRSTPRGTLTCARAPSTWSGSRGASPTSATTRWTGASPRAIDRGGLTNPDCVGDPCQKQKPKPAATPPQHRTPTQTKARQGGQRGPPLLLLGGQRARRCRDDDLLPGAA